MIFISLIQPKQSNTSRHFAAAAAMDAWENGCGGADSYSSSTTVTGGATAEIFDEQAAAGEETETEVFVAVPEQHKSGKSLLAWAIRHVGAVAGAAVVVAHVHAPAQMIPMSTCAPASPPRCSRAAP